MLVKIYHIFNDLYVAQGLSYRAFCRQALKGLCSVEINCRIVTQSVEKIATAYSRVYDVLKHHRGKVIEAFKRKSSFDTEAALLLLAFCEKRINRGKKDNAPEFPEAKLYNELAQCANEFGVFSTAITGNDLIDFRDGKLAEAMHVPVKARVAFFLSLLGRTHLLPRNWKKLAETKRMLVYDDSGEFIDSHTLQTSAARLHPELYLADNTSPKYKSRETYYEKLARAVRNVVS